MTARIIEFNLDKDRFLTEEEIGPLKQQTYSTGKVICSFTSSPKGGCAVSFFQQLRFVTRITTTDKDGKSITRVLHDTKRDSCIATLHFSDLYNHSIDRWSGTIITIGEALAKEHLIGSSANRGVWDIIWWTFHKQWGKAGKKIAQAYPEWWTGFAAAYPGLDQKKV